MSLENIIKIMAITSPIIIFGAAIYFGFDDVIKQDISINYKEGRIISSIFFGFIGSSPLSYKLLQKFYPNNYK